MDRYEDFLLRTYASRVLQKESAGRFSRPSCELAVWLFQHAADLGCQEPDIDPDKLEFRIGRVDKETWSKFKVTLANLNRSARPPPPSAMERRMKWLGETLELSGVEADILRVALRVALERPVRALADACGGGGGPGEVNAAGMAAMTGHDIRIVKRLLLPGQPLCLLGLLEDRDGGDFTPSATVLRIARLSTTQPQRLRTALVGKTAKAQLSWEDFAHLGAEADLAERLLAGALETRAVGINILLHGAPGTGKTEFVRTLAGRLGAHPMFVGETGDEAEEPTRSARVAAFAIARSLASRTGRTLLVVDEADDIFTGVDDDDAGSRVGSKVFMNRLVERTGAPTVWITNHEERLGPAVLRRMSLAIRFPEPGRAVRRRVAQRIAARRKLPLAPEARLSEVAASPAVMNAAMGVAKLTGGQEGDVALAARSVMRAMQGPTPPFALIPPMPFDPALCEADHDLAALATRIVASGERAISFCLHGVPDAGKSAFARHLAERMGLDVIEKRASDLLSKWVGESEKAIATTFQEAADRRAMLIIDEADSLLRDRAGAHASWEVSQVNEMLSWMERHPWPFACTTNALDALDPATLRRFLFKIKFLPMRSDQAREAFRGSFGVEAPKGLERLEGLTPGDFALVARRARVLTEGDAAALMKMLTDEVAAKPSGGRQIGF